MAERLLQDAVGALELYTVYLGERLGLYRALADGGPATSSDRDPQVGRTIVASGDDRSLSLKENRGC